MASTQDILRVLDEYKRKPESYGLKLRLNLAELVIQQLNSNGWSQRDLAQKTGLKEAYISRILHSDANCTFESAGKILFALGIKVALLPEPEWTSTDDLHGNEIDQEGGTEEPCILRLTQTDSSERIGIAEAARSNPEVALG
jgi:transcriptional regulator with XRE-family HTH domain